MATHELRQEVKHDPPLGQKQQFGFWHDNNVDMGPNQKLEIRQTLDHGMDLGQSDASCLSLAESNEPDCDLDTDYVGDEQMMIVSVHDNDVTSKNISSRDCHHKNGVEEEEEVENKRENDHNREHHGDADKAHGGYDNHLDLVLADENGGLVNENAQEFQKNLIFEIDNNQEMGFLVPILTFQEPELFLSPTTVQSRTTVLILDHQLRIGQEFTDVKSCRRALRDASIALHYEMKTIKSDKNRFTATCAIEGCPWRIHAAKLPGVPTFTIRTLYGNHTCGGIDHLGHQQASVEWVANSVEQRLRENPTCKPKDILEEIHRVHGITLSYKQAWRGKERIMAAVPASLEEGYRLLPLYCDQIRRTNPGSIAHVYGNPVDNSFQCMFVSFQASIYGFLNGCQPLLGLDSMVLKSMYLGTLLIATGFDGDGALFPLAFGVVDEETDARWMWFLSELQNLLEYNNVYMPRLTILSGIHKGIADAVEANFPTAFHGICMHHLTESFAKVFNNKELVNLLWEAAKALTAAEFDSIILEMQVISSDAAHWVRSIPTRQWATAYFEGTRFGHLVVNAVESMSPWILEASGLPIVQMMESIRRQLMTSFHERREMSMLWTNTLVPTAERQVLEAIDQAQNYQVYRANDAEFEVISLEGSNTVDIRNRWCNCNKWQKHGLPCTDAVAALASCRQNVHRFTESFFTVASYRKTYSQTIHPIPDKKLWNELMPLGQSNQGVIDVIMEPPKLIQSPSRPRKRQILAEDHGRVKRVVHCSRCNQTGHFRTTCTAPA
ncbi:hypothetical protein AKJ16_DCAP18849 [Drosera capensis]